MFRRPFLLVALILIGGLDLARSLYVRRQVSNLVSSSHPFSTRESATGKDGPDGATLYARHCATCHGPQGRGDGPVATSLFPRPRDFTGGVFKLKSTAGAAAPTLDDVRASIRQGIPDTSMPRWDDILSDAEIDAVADVVRRFGPHTEWSSEEAALAVPDLSGDVARGRRLYGSLGCPSCHAADGRGGGASAAALRDVWKQPAPPRDLSSPWSFRGGAEATSVYRRIAHGISGTPMPGYLEVATPSEIADVVAYVASIARKPPWEEYDPGTANGIEALHRGEILIRAGLCATCHATPRVVADAVGDPGEPVLAGGRPIDAGAHGVLFASNLTPDPETGVGTMSTAAIALSIQTGHRRGSRLNPVVMPWILYGSLTADDALAMATYLQSLPPITHPIPTALRFGFIETVLRKLGYNWPMTLPPRLTLLAAHVGADPLPPSASQVPTVLVWLQIGLLVLAILSLFRARAPSPGEEQRSSAVLMSSVVASIVVGTAALVVYWYPALNAVPAKPLVDAFASSVPVPPAADALQQRGRYLYVTSCAFCHNGNGAGGGKLNSPSFGSVWSANLTPDPTGLATWSDAVVLRAITAGVRSDGRAIHPESMPWPELSRLPLVDRYALIAFLRSLPAVDLRVPDPLPPSSDDCVGLTFWIGGSSTSGGCE